MSGKTLAGVELFRSRVEATYAPPDWGGLKIRASWSPTEAGDGMDLEIQVSATSVDELRTLEVFVVSRFLDPGSPTADQLSSWVYPRDPCSAALSYDGREPGRMLTRLTTLPVPLADVRFCKPVAMMSPWPSLPGYYVGMIHPQDVSRQIVLGKGPLEPSGGFAFGTRHGLFGHDLEKGVVVRGRMRGLWVRGAELAEHTRTAFRRFLESPPPLGM